MVLTTILFCVVAYGRWGWSLATALIVIASFLLIDISFFSSNIMKIALEGLKLDPQDTTFFLGRENLLVAKGPMWSTWRKRLFAFLSRNSQDATRFFRIPPNHVVELGIQVEFRWLHKKYFANGSTFEISDARRVVGS